ncbi:MAG TPA: hypothetical protein VG873_16770 [Burkholderiales bacterium]|nr:hypothetical protein [Burkholderiales bacterium]
MRRTLCALLLAAGNALAQAQVPCGWEDKACAQRAIPDHPVRGIAYWAPALRQPLAARIGPAPREVLQYLELDNISNGIANRPRPARLDATFLEEVRHALAGLPAKVTVPLKDRLAGIHFLEDFGGTGFFDEVRDAEDRAVAGFVVLDPSALQRTANEWATWKERSPFAPGGPVTLQAVIREPAEDTRRHAIQYILLHELGHMMAIGADVHPSWRLQPAQVRSTRRYAFFRLSWRHAPDRKTYATRFDDAFPQRKDVVYYFGPKLAAAQMLGTYEALERTSFVTLYGATNPYDDFAEAFASYVHVVLMGKPWEIRLLREGAPVKTYRTCWDEPRCAEKRRILEALLR